MIIVSVANAEGTVTIFYYKYQWTCGRATKKIGKQWWWGYALQKDCRRAISIYSIMTKLRASGTAQKYYYRITKKFEEESAGMQKIGG